MVNSKQNRYIPAAYKQGEPCWFQSLCRGNSGSPVPPGSSCTSPWPLGGLSSDPPILWDYVKVEGELIGQPWLLNDTTGGLVALPLVCMGSVKTPHRVSLCSSDSTSPTAFFCIPQKTMTSCVPQRKAEESLAHRGLITYLAIWPFTCSPASIF